MHHDVQIGQASIPPGERRRMELPVARLPTQTQLSMPLEILNGAADGAKLWLSAAVHGDELNGVEIIRRVLAELHPKRLRGSIIAAPIVNVFGFVHQSRYLPDRRDLNRCFPGSARGSLASRLAHLFLTEVVGGCTHGVDLHTGSNHRRNLPQIRANLQHEETRRCAAAFAAPVMIDAHVRDGSLREAAAERGIPVLVYEAGEPHRFNEDAISLGMDGVLRVMAALDMIDVGPAAGVAEPVVVANTRWVRARRGGILRLAVELGQRVEAKQRLGVISDAMGENRAAVLAPAAGLIIGLQSNPLVNQGDSVIHLAVEG